jgi:hypothetical protein
LKCGFESNTLGLRWQDSISSSFLMLPCSPTIHCNSDSPDIHAQGVDGYLSLCRVNNLPCRSSTTWYGIRAWWRKQQSEREMCKYRMKMPVKTRKLLFFVPCIS